MPITLETSRRLDAPSTGTSPGWFTKTARHWLVVCRSHSLADTVVKVAELGGGQDVPFEQAFSNLAHAYIKDKAPKLLDYEVGFQLIEKNQENTKAVGVFGFKVGSQWLYAPVFFLNGDLKGHELLYIKSQDAFVPMKEAWINYLLGRKPSILGEGVGRNLSQLGVTSPNLNQLSRSPNKYAADLGRMATHVPAMQKWALEFMPVLGYLTQTPIDENHPKYQGMRGLEDFLKEAGAPAVVALLEACKAYPKFAEAVDRFYGADFLEKVTKEAAARRPARYPTLDVTGGDNFPSKPKAKRVQNLEVSTRKINMDTLFAKPAEKKGGVRVITTSQVYAQGLDVIHDLSKDEKETLVKERVVIKDTRDDDQVTIAYNVQTKLELQNPDKTSVYEVLVKPDEFKKCLVVMGPYNNRRRETFCTVIQLEGEHRWTNTHPSNVWTRSTYDEEAFRKWWDGLSEAKSLPEEGGLTVLLGYSGEGTCPFRVWDAESAEESASKLYRVSFRDYASDSRAGWLPAQSPSSRMSSFDDASYGPELIRLTGKPGAKIRASGGELWIPDGYKKLSLKKPKEDKKDDEPCCSYDSDPGPLDLGNILDLQLFIHSSTQPLKILSDGKDVHVDGTKYDKVAAVIHLVKDKGLREKQARVLIEQAEQAHRRGGNAAHFRLFKQAAPGDPIGDMVSGAPSAPPFPEPEIGSDSVMGSSVPTMYESEHSVGVPDMSASRTDREIYDPRTPDPRSMAVAQQAAQTGQKEVFDTSAFSALIRSVRPDNMVDRYLGDMMKGMDRTGRVLFNFYWHGEEFEDRYGKQDMPELEDGLRNSFEGQGDIILKLKQKTVDADPADGLSIDLSEVANS